MRWLFNPALALVMWAVPLTAPSASAQWDPQQGDWGKSDADHIRVMCWNIADRVCSTAGKQEGTGSWHGFVVMLAAMKPDVVLLQEVGDNTGNGTGSGVDSVANLTTTLELLIHGGNDPFLGGSVGSYIQKYAPTYDLPHIVVSQATDGFNRNVVMSRFPLTDLNGDGLSAQFTTPGANGGGYSAGGSGGIRGFQIIELDLPDASYASDLVIGNGHLKSGGSTSDFSQRLTAAQNISYYAHAMLAGAGTGTPDPLNVFSDSPQVTSVLDVGTLVVLGGDLNEDEDTNGRRGPAEWFANGEFNGGTDGTDRDGTDGVIARPTDVFTGSDTTQGSNRRLDYLIHWDSAADSIREFSVLGSNIPASARPPEFAFHPDPGDINRGFDHRPIMVDYEMLGASTEPPGPFLLQTPADSATDVPVDTVFTWTEPANAGTYTLTIARDIGFSDIVASFADLTSTSFSPPPGTLQSNEMYFWTVLATNNFGSRQSFPLQHDFITAAPSTPPGPFLLQTPADTATDVPVETSFGWTASADAEDYTITIATDFNFANIIGSFSGVAGTSFTPPPGTLLAGQTHYWRVVAFNSVGSRDGFPAQFRFTTQGVAAPGPFALLSPADGETDVPFDAELSWGESSEADSFTVTLARDAGFSDLIGIASGLPAAALNTITLGSEIAAPPSCETVFWRVEAFNAGGVTASTPASASFRAASAADLADSTGFGPPDGLVDFGDFFALSFLTGPCGQGTPNPTCAGDLADASGFGPPDGIISFGDFFALSFAVGPTCP